MFRGFRLGLGPVALSKRTVTETIEDDCAGIAAQLAYYFVLALFPALIFTTALASYLPFPVVNDLVGAPHTSIVSALNKAYDIPETRPWWKVRLVAIGLTLALDAFVLLSFTLIVAGPNAGRWLTGWFGLSHVFDTAWVALRWPLTFVFATTGIRIGAVDRR